ncbi:MAG: hypothetical protein AAF193_06865, partial [Bacteroidota bacterium]
NCFDGILNNNEERIDCGGPCTACDPCENGQIDFLLGETWVDCGGDCGPCDQSFNGIQDGDETGIDCGGSTMVDCAELCNDGLFNGLEEGVDCGGPCDDCPTCTDGILNQDEIGIDCGGMNCPDCPTDGDCTNNELDGDELYIDCGGTICEPCEEFINYSYNGTDIESLTITGVWDGGNNRIILTGQTGANAEIVITLEEPLTSWTWEVGDPSLTFSLDNAAPEGTLNFVAFGDPFSTANPDGNGSVNVSFVTAEAGGFIVGTFSSSPTNFDGSEDANVSQGTFRVALDD